MNSRLRLNRTLHTRYSLLFWAFAVGMFLQFPISITLAETNAADEFILPWESRPYQVQVWIATDQTADIETMLPKLGPEIERRTSILDPSGWNVSVANAPDQWRTYLLNSIESTERLNELGTSESIRDFDKLTIICLTRFQGAIRYQVREFDVQTGQWGALFQRSCPQARDLASGLISGIRRVFMPLARIDRVSDQGDVFIRARAINACQIGDVFEVDAPPTPIQNSPVWIRPEDRFLPVIRRVDRNGDLAQLEPLAFTFLTVESPEGSRMTCKLHSRQRAILGGRSSKRAQKLALVIRPPESSTELKLVSRGEDKQALSGYEIYSRPPGAPKEEESEFLGLTDWRGIIEVPPADQGLRLIYVKRGSRPLMKLPIIPGLYDKLETPVPDDEARLNAEGITNGFQIEILNLVAQRELFQSQIKAAVDQGNADQARQFFQEFQKLESGQNLKIRLADEETRLKNSTLNNRELGRIVSMFQRLNSLVNKNIHSSLESELQALILKAK